MPLALGGVTLARTPASTEESRRYFLLGRWGEVLLAQGTRPDGAQPLLAKTERFISDGRATATRQYGVEPSVRGVLIKLTLLTTWHELLGSSHPHSIVHLQWGLQRANRSPVGWMPFEMLGFMGATDFWEKSGVLADTVNMPSRSLRDSLDFGTLVVQ